MTQATVEYLAAAEASGLLSRLDDRPMVAGGYDDPLTGERLCFIEYCDPVLLADSERMAQVTTELCRRFPQAIGILARVPAHVRLSAPWRVTVTYIRLPDDAPGPDPGAVHVVPATAGYDEVITGWLVEALLAGYGSRAGEVDAGAVVAVTRDMLAAPDRRSYVALRDGEPVGHVTLFRDATDEVTGEVVVDLFDVLVEPATGADLSTTTAALVAAAVREAREVGRPLQGNVLHRADDEQAGQRVLDSLARRGWLANHAMWRRPACG